MFRIFLILIVCCLWNSSGRVLPSSQESACVQEPRDIFLVVDGSASVTNEGFEKVRSFILDVIRASDVREDMTHFGLMQFSSKQKTKIEFPLDESHDADVLLDKVRKLKYHAGSRTRTGLALGIAEQQVFTPTGDDRPHVKDYLILFTDGEASDKRLALINAEKLKKKGVHIVAIAAGQKKMGILETLEKIASSPSSVYMADFDGLKSLVTDIVKDIVNEVCPTPTPDPTSMICSQEPRDVFLVVDGSRSIGHSDFKKIRAFLLKLVKSVIVSPEMTHFGLLQFSNIRKTRVEFSLDYSHREATLLNRIKYMRYQQGDSTRTGNALKIVDEQVFTPEGDDRPLVQDILVVFTDGATRDQEIARKYAKNLRDRNVHILAIAAGPKRKQFRHQLVEIASSPDDVMMVEFDNLDGVIGKLVNKVCKQPTTTAPPTTTPAPTTLPTTTLPPTTTPRPTTTAPPTTTLPPTTTPAPTTRPPLCHYRQRKDILFMVDSPVTMRRRQFSLVKGFMKSLIDLMPVENGDFMVAVMQLTDTLTPDMYLNFTMGRTKRALKLRIHQMKQEGALRKFDVGSFGSAGYEFHRVNYKYGRRDAEDVIILITTRVPNNIDSAAHTIELYQQMGVTVIPLAVGRRSHVVSMRLQQISTNVKLPYVSKYRNLKNHVLDVMHDLCPNPSGVPGTPRPPTPSCRRTPHDIFFVVDGSASIKSRNFDSVRKFLMDFLDLLQIGISDINVGLLQFSQVDKTRILLDLDKHPLVQQMHLVDNMKYQAGRRTMTGDALTRVRTSVFNGLGGDRPGVRDVLILFTDGNAHDLPVALKEAGNLKVQGVRVITIGAGVKREIANFEDELKAMSSDPETDFLSVDFKDLDGFANKAFPLICRDRRRL